MILFTTDLDGTVLYAKKHLATTEGATCVEVYKDHRGYITDKTISNLKKLSNKMEIVPLTTRSIEQFVRIDFPKGILSPYALVCNGGILLKDGKIDSDWYNVSLEIAEKAKGEILKGMEILETDPNRSFEIRHIKDLFVFTKSHNPQETLKMLEALLDLKKVFVLAHGEKMYIVPIGLDKGSCIARFREHFGFDTHISAGDTAFDVPFLNISDIAFFPEDIEKYVDGKCELNVCREGYLSDFMTDELLKRYYL